MLAAAVLRRAPGSGNRLARVGPGRGIDARRREPGVGVLAEGVQEMPRAFQTGLVVLALAAAIAASAAGTEPKIQARVEFSSVEEWRAFLSLPDLDIMKSKPGVGVTIVTDAEQLDEIRSLGYDVTVEIENMQEFYASRIRGPNFGAFHTYSETIDFLDALHAAYPSITTEKFSIGVSHELNDIYAIKISDNPDVDEAEPEVVYDGLHHAREPMSIEVQLYYMTWLCENYGTDPEATYLVDNREIFFVPIVNPDGYLYNESTDPNGGGMWRKNRRDNPGSCEGVDVNRNYPYEWGGVGSSSDPCSEVYRGPSAGSEPEVQAYMDFVADRDFVLNLSFHSVAGMVLFPWSYTHTVHTDDDALFRDIADVMAQYNGYQTGQPGEILYDCSGTTTDWMYGDPGILALCIEVSGSGFWPAESEIPGLNEECLWPQIYMTRIAGPYLSVEDYTFAGGDGDQEPEAGETLDLTVTIENQGVAGDVTNATVTLVTDDAYVQLHDAASSLGTVTARSTVDNSGDPFSFTLDPSVPDGHNLTLILVLEGDDFYAEEELSWLVGEPTVLFFDDMESGTGNWIENDGNWGLTTGNFHSESHSYTDSPSGNYGNYWNSWIELAAPVDLSHASQAELTFWHRVNTEEGYDFCYVEASGDGGTTWSQIGPSYDGDINWQLTELPIAEEFCTGDFKVRYRLVTDTYVTDDGWYVDDVSILGPPPGNVSPTAPTLVDPPDGGSVTTPCPTLTVANADDPDEGDVLTYGFFVYSDELRTVVEASTCCVSEGAGTTSWTVDVPLADGVYWWSAYADDGTERGPLMETGSFTVESSGADDLPSKIVLYPARPNPFECETELSFDLPAREEATLAVYSVDGRLVRTLVAGAVGPGPVAVRWDGRDSQGHGVASGLYLLRLEAAGAVRRGKVVLLR